VAKEQRVGGAKPLLSNAQKRLNSWSVDTQIDARIKVLAIPTSIIKAISAIRIGSTMVYAADE
jgi:hypothetical protein